MILLMWVNRESKVIVIKDSTVRGTDRSVVTDVNPRWYVISLVPNPRSLTGKGEQPDALVHIGTITIGRKRSYRQNLRT